MTGSSSAGPAITALAYATNNVVTALLDPLATLPATVAVFVGNTGGAQIGIAAAQGGLAAITISQPVAGQTYVAAATFGDGSNPTWGPASNLVWRQPVLGSVVVNDSGVSISWTKPASVTGVQAALVDVAQGAPLVSERTVATAVNLVPPIALPPTGDYAVGLTGVDGLSGAGSGPPIDPVPLILVSPAVASAGYGPGSGGAFNIVVTPRGSLPAGLTAIAQLLADGRLIAQSPGSATAPVVTLAAALDPAARWQVRLAYTNGVVTGPPGVAADIPTQPPQLTSLAFDGTSFQIAWLPPASSPGATGAAISVRRASDGVEIGSATQPNGTSVSVTPTIPVDPTLSYQVHAAPILGSAVGLFGASAPVIVATPAIASIVCDGEWAQVTLSAAPAAAVGTLFTLLSAGGTIARTEGGLGGGLVRIGGTAAGATLTAQAVDGRGGHGPASTPVPVVTAAPSILTAAGEAAAGANPASCTIGWAWAGGTVSGYEILLLSPGAADSVAATVTDPSTTSVKVVFASPPPVGSRLAVRAVAGSAKGPSSGAAAVLLDPPVLAAVYDGHRLSLTWTGSTGVTGVEILQASTVVAATRSAAGAVSIPLEAVAGASYQARAWSSEGPATGPATILALVTDRCTITSATTAADATSLTLAWTAPAGASTFEAIFVAGGATVGTLPLTGTTAGEVVQLEPGLPAGTTIAVLASAGAAGGPVGNEAPILTGAPTGLTVRYDGGILSARWDEATDPRIDGYWVPPIGAGTVRPARVSGNSWSVAVAGPSGPVGVSVAAAGGPGIGPASPAATALAGAPIPTSLALDGSTVTAGWSALTGAQSYVVRLLSAGEEIARAYTGQTRAILAAAGAKAPLGVTIAAITGAGTGPQQSPSVALAQGVGPVAQASSDAVSGAVGIGWTAVAAATGYLVQFFLRGEPQGDPVSVAGTSTPLPTVLQARTDVQAAVATQSAVGGVTLTGPYGPRLLIPTEAPQLLAADYDGASVTASWTGVAGAWGYRVNLVDKVAKTVVHTFPDTRSTQATWPYALPAGATAEEVRVQALTGPGSGPPSNGLPLLGRAWFVSTPTDPSQQAPYVALAMTGALTPADIVVDLPSLFPTPEPPSPLPSTPPFALTYLGDTGPLRYQLRMAATSSAWTFPVPPAPGPPVRSGLLTAYRSFLAALAGLNALPSAIADVQEAISRSMPQTFQETLLYAYGLAFDQGSFDLRPGMVLRVEYESRQSLGTAEASQFLSGFVSGGVADYEVASYLQSGRRLVGLDAFLANLTVAQGTTVTPAAPDPSGRSFGGGGILDAFYTQFRQPFCRVVYPPAFLGNDATGSPYPQFNAVLIAASNLADLDTATRNIRNALAPGNSVACFYLRGRTVLRPMVRVTIDGAPRLVPVGTTVGNLLAGSAARPAAAGLALTGLRLLRARGAAILDAPDSAAQYRPGQAWPVRLDWQIGAGAGSTGAWLDLPLLHGDRLDLPDPPP